MAVRIMTRLSRLVFLFAPAANGCQTLGGIYLTAAIEDSTKKIILYIEVYSMCCHYVMGACFI